MAQHRKNYDHAAVLYNSGLSLADVALACGVTRQAIWKILKRCGVIFRQRLRYGEDNHFFRDGIPCDARVHNITMKAIARGVLIAMPCESCGKKGIGSDGRNLVHAHHDDYNKPLVVRWLCQECHYRWHEVNRPTRRTVALPPMPHEEICRLGGKASRRKRK